MGDTNISDTTLQRPEVIKLFSGRVKENTEDSGFRGVVDPVVAQTYRSLQEPTGSAIFFWGGGSRLVTHAMNESQLGECRTPHAPQTVQLDESWRAKTG